MRSRKYPPRSTCTSASESPFERMTIVRASNPSPPSVRTPSIGRRGPLKSHTPAGLGFAVSPSCQSSSQFRSCQSAMSPLGLNAEFSVVALMGALAKPTTRCVSPLSGQSALGQIRSGLNDGGCGCGDESEQAMSQTPPSATQAKHGRMFFPPGKLNQRAEGKPAYLLAASQVG